MKKLLLIVSMAFCFTANAQLAIGGKVGVNFSNFTGSSFGDAKKSTKVGYFAGGYFNIWLGDNLAIAPEVLVSLQGAKFDSFDVELTYINVPLMLKWKSDGGFYLELGPQFGFKVNENSGSMSSEDFVNDLDLSAAAGLGYQVSGRFGIGARYVLGLSKLGETNSTVISNPNFKNSVIQLGIFFGFGGPE